MLKHSACRDVCLAIKLVEMHMVMQNCMTMCIFTTFIKNDPYFGNTLQDVEMMESLVIFLTSTYFWHILH